MAINTNRDLAFDFVPEKRDYSGASVAALVIPQGATTLHIRFLSGGFVFRPGVTQVSAQSTGGEQLVANQWGSYPVGKYADGETTMIVRNFGTALGVTNWRWDLAAS